MADTDAISMLKDDHKIVEQLFRRFENAGGRAHVEKRHIVGRIVEDLSMHAAIEEELFYPVARATVPGAEDIALESLEEHRIVKWVLSELDTMTPEDERFDAKVTVVIDNVRQHVKEEEEQLFPMVRGELGRKALNELGETMVAARKVAPTHPHPRSPDTPPANLVVATATGIADRVGDTVSGLAQGYVSAMRDIIATLLRRKKPRVSPTGSKVTRTTATRVRSTASDVTDAAVEAARKAKHTGERSLRTLGTTGSSAKAGAQRTARTATAGVKDTVSSARTSTKRAVGASKRGATTTGRTARTAAKTTATSAQRSASKTASTAKRSARAS